MNDRYTQAVLTIIALALVLNLFRPEVPVAHAAEEVRCTVAGPIDVRVTSFTDDVEVSWGFAQPGSSSSNPLHVRAVQ